MTEAIQKKVDDEPTQELVEHERQSRLAVLDSQAYAKVKERNLMFLDPARLQTMAKMADIFINSGAFPKMSVPQAIVMLQAGFERGMQPMEALNTFYFIGGKMAMQGDGVIAMVMDAGHTVEWGICDETEATVTITRGDNGKSMTGHFTMEMAKKRGLANKDNYRNYPDSMMKYRAFGSIARFLVPDALRGVQIKEEMESTDVVESKVVEPVKPIQLEKPKSNKPVKKEKKKVLPPVKKSVEHSSLQDALSQGKN